MICNLGIIICFSLFFLKKVLVPKARMVITLTFLFSWRWLWMTCRARQENTCTWRPCNPLHSKHFFGKMLSIKLCTQTSLKTQSLSSFLYYSSSFLLLFFFLSSLQTWRSGLLDQETSFLAWDVIWICRGFSWNVITLLVTLLQTLSYLRDQCFWIPSRAYVTSLREWRNSLIWFSKVTRKTPRYTLR